MNSPTMKHPSSASFTQRTEHFPYNSKQNADLCNEASALIDTYVALDNSRMDLDETPGRVRLESPAGNVVTEFSYYNKVTNHGSSIDRDGKAGDDFFSERLTTASFKRTELNSKAMPFVKRRVELNYEQSGAVITKEFFDKSGTSVATGGSQGHYQVDYKA